MTNLIDDVRAVYRKEGPLALSLKGLRTGLTLVVGEERARSVQYSFARAVRYRQPSPPRVQLSNGRVTIRDEGAKIFFGFYDHSPFCHRNRRVLFNRTTTPTRPIKPKDTLTVGYCDIETGTRHTFGETVTWNWQQGCRLHWHPTMADTVVYNTLVDDEYGSVIRNVDRDQIVQELRSPLYDTDPRGRFGLTLNFSRLERLHPDYGYVNLPDETCEVPSPSDDGIVRVDLETGETDVLVSYEELAVFDDVPPGVHNYVMNLMISPDGERVSFLHRYHHEGSRVTSLLCARTDDGSIQALERDGRASHPRWRTETELLSTVNFWGAQRRTEFVVYDLESNTRRTFDHPDLNVDGHPSFSPANADLFVCDTYPDVCGERTLYTYDIDADRFEELGRVYGPVYNGIKRDLHPRWDREGRFVCIDIPEQGNSQSLSLIPIE